MSTQTQQKTNVQLRNEILDEIDWDTSIDASQIGVAAGDGIVTLTGHVATYAEKHEAESVVRKIRGVKAVANEIDVRLADSHQRDDAEIAAAAVHALEWNAKVPWETVQVIVDRGWITLEGTVLWRYQKMAADRAVRHLLGARGVTNSIVVAPHEGAQNASMREVCSDVEAALQRSAIRSLNNIKVEAKEETIVLTGDVHTLSERDEAIRKAWSTRGVRNVEDCITITPWGAGPAQEWGY